jgi:hypothetical protein
LYIIAKIKKFAARGHPFGTSRERFAVHPKAIGVSPKVIGVNPKTVWIHPKTIRVHPKAFFDFYITFFYKIYSKTGMA